MTPYAVALFLLKILPYESDTKLKDENVFEIRIEICFNKASFGFWVC